MLSPETPITLAFISANCSIASANSCASTVQTLVKVEQRNLLAQRVDSEMEARNDFARAPGVVRRFLTGPWAQVVAQARLEANAPGIDLPARDQPEPETRERL